MSDYHENLMNNYYQEATPEEWDEWQRKQRKQGEKMQIGDIVEAVSPFILHCGSGIYRDAVVASTDPLIVISRSGDMRWSATITEEKLRVVGKANSETMQVVMRRLSTGR